MKKIYDNVKLGKDCEIGEFTSIGVPPKGKKDGELETIVGDSSVIRSHTVIYAGNKIGNCFQTGHGANIRESNNIGNNVSIGTKSVVEHHVRIEDDVRIHSLAFIPEFTVLKKGCWIGPHTSITNAKHPKSRRVKESLKGAVIGEGAVIGANATLLPGINIGKNAVIGAGSVVTDDVDEESVVIGNPAREIKKRKDLKCKGEVAYR